MKARWLFAASVAIVGLDLLLRALGADADTSVISGMPRDALSYVAGPVYVLVSLATVAFAPILAIAGALDVAVSYLGGAWRARARAARSPSSKARRDRPSDRAAGEGYAG